jgi:hypothetical protein
VKGIDPWNAKIVSAEVNWVNLKGLHSDMGIDLVGVYNFAKLFGRIILSLPNYLKEGYFLAPMPAAFMFNYMMTVTAVPCENLTGLSSSTLSNSVNRKVDVINTLILPDGTGAVLVGYQLTTLKYNSLALLFKNPSEVSFSGPNLNPSVVSRSPSYFSDEPIVRTVEVRTHPMGLRELDMVVVLEVLYVP